VDDTPMIADLGVALAIACLFAVGLLTLWLSQ